MSTIERLVYINLAETGWLSLRVVPTLQTILNITFRDPSNTILAADTAAQLQLTGLTDKLTQTFLMPAIDIVNGLARAVIPAGALTDPNGYRLRLYGTYAGDLMLFAQGTVVPIAGGADSPVAVPLDSIDQIALTLNRGEDVDITVDLWQDASKTTPFNFATSGAAITAGLYDRYGGTQIRAFNVTVVDANSVRLTLVAEQTESLPDLCWWSLLASTSTGVTTLAEGEVTVQAEVIPPLPDSTMFYNFSHPATLQAPADGEAVQSAGAPDTLRFAILGDGGVNYAGVLSALRGGDMISRSTVTWEVVESNLIGDGYFSIIVATPALLEPSTGVQDFEVHRP